MRLPPKTMSDLKNVKSTLLGKRDVDPLIDIKQDSKKVCSQTKTVYIVMEDTTDRSYPHEYNVDVKGVFTSFERAREFQKKIQKEEDLPDSYWDWEDFPFDEYPISYIEKRILDEGKI